jgi:hypothetical protein
MSNLQITVTVGSEIDARRLQEVLGNWVQGNLLEPQYDRLFPKPIAPVEVGPTIESK